MKVLVTGAGGFIGSHLVELFAEEGYDVKAFLRYTSYSFQGSIRFIKEKLSNRIEIFYGDLRDIESVKKAIKGCDAVIHLASVISVPYSFKAPREVLQTNIFSTLNILQVLKENPLPYIHISSSEVYGKVFYTPIDENHPKTASSPYAVSKIANDELVKSFASFYEIPFKIIRPFNTYGPWQSHRALIPSVILQVLRTGKLKLGNLFPKRDFLFVKDTVQGIVLSLQKNDGFKEEINLATGESHSVEYVVDSVFKILKKPKEIHQDAKRIRPQNVEIPELLGSYEKAKKILGFKPSVSFEEGLKITCEWFKENQNFFPDIEVF